jgi:hypothetical protein
MVGRRTMKKRGDLVDYGRIFGFENALDELRNSGSQSAVWGRQEL